MQQRSPDAFRIQDLTRFFRYKYGTELPDDDAGRDDMRAMFEHMARLNNGRARMKSFAELWAPWLSADELGTLIDDITAGPPRFDSADELGQRIGLKDAVRTALTITTIGGIGCNKEQRLARRKAEKAAAERERRRLKGLAVADRYVRAVYVLPASHNTKPIDECSVGARLVYRWLDGKGKRTIPELADATIAANSTLNPIARSPQARKLDRDAIRRKILRYCSELVDGGLIGWELVPAIRSDVRQVWRLDQAV